MPVWDVAWYLCTQRYSILYVTLQLNLEKHCPRLLLSAECLKSNWREKRFIWLSVGGWSIIAGIMLWQKWLASLVMGPCSHLGGSRNREKSSSSRVGLHSLGHDLRFYNCHLDNISKKFLSLEKVSLSIEFHRFKHESEEDMSHNGSCYLLNYVSQLPNSAIEVITHSNSGNECIWADNLEYSNEI